MDLTALNHEDPILRVLSAAQERIRDPEHWCRGSFARPCMPEAQQWCAVGAILAEGLRGHSADRHLLDKSAANRHLDEVAGKFGYSGAIELNDSTDHPTVMAMFDCARELRMADMMEATVA